MFVSKGETSTQVNTESSTHPSGTIVSLDQMNSHKIQKEASPRTGAPEIVTGDGTAHIGELTPPWDRRGDSSQDTPVALQLPVSHQEWLTGVQKRFPSKHRFALTGSRGTF